MDQPRPVVLGDSLCAQSSRVPAHGNAVLPPDGSLAAKTDRAGQVTPVPKPVSYREDLRDRLRSMKAGPPLPPWRTLKPILVGGLTEMGFANVIEGSSVLTPPLTMSQVFLLQGSVIL